MFWTSRQIARSFFCFGVLVSLVASSLLAPTALAQRPPAAKLFPAETLVYVRMADVPNLLEKFRETALGRISGDEQVKPLVSKLYATLQQAWTQIEDRVGLPLDSILKIPQGEVAFAIVDRQDQPPGGVFILDVKDQINSVKKLLEKGEEAVKNQGATKTTEVLGADNLEIFTAPGGEFSIFMVERNGTYVLANQKDLVVSVLAAWDGNPSGPRLAENDRFNSVMNRCVGSPENPPQFTWYVEPIVLTRRLVRGTGAALITGFFPALGLDGLQAVGGSATFSAGEFDQIQHIHLLLANPRSGIMELLALGAGDTSPESFVPSDATTYTTFHVRAEEFVKNGTKLFNSLQGEGALENEVKNRLSENLGVDVLAEIVPALDGRMTLFGWIERPIRLNSQTQNLAIKLKDAAAFQPTLDKIFAKVGERLVSKSFGGVSYKTIDIPVPAQAGANADDEAPGINSGRQPKPCIAILGDYLFITDSEGSLKKAITTMNDPSQSLSQQLDYKLVASKIRRQPGGDAVGFVTFNQPEEAMRMFYDLATADSTKKRLAEQADRNPFFRSVDQAMKDSPLPPFAVIARYLAPGGGMITSDETGFHYMAFGLKRK